MNKFKTHTGKMVALYRQNIDTDQIMPKQFLTRIERSGFGEFLFHNWRFDSNGAPNNDFILNDPKYENASILITGENFGCGSSREHAPWGLLDYGFRVIISSSFADIFYNNSLKNGLLPIVLEKNLVNELIKKSVVNTHSDITINLSEKTISNKEGLFSSFEIDNFRRECLLSGLDDIALTLQHEKQISKYEAQRTLSHS